MLSKRQVYLLLPLSILLSFLLTVAPVGVVTYMYKEVISGGIAYALTTVAPLLQLLLVYWVWRKKIDVSHIFQRKNGVRLFLYGVLLSTAIFLTSSAIGYMLSFLEFRYQYSPSVSGYSISVFVFLVLIKCLIVSASEELLFRGILLRKLRQHAAPIKALGFSSFVFVLFHFASTPSSILYFFCSSLLFGYLYLRSKSVFLPMGLHFAINLTYYVTHTNDINSFLTIPPIITLNILNYHYTFLSQYVSAETLNELIYSLIMGLVMIIAEVYRRPFSSVVKDRRIVV